MRSEIDDIESTVRLAGKVDLEALSGPALGEVVQRLGRVRSAVDALHTRAVGAFDRSRAWVDDGHKSAAAAVAARTGERRGRAHNQVLLARKLQEMPVTAEALDSGEVSADRAARLGKAQERLPEAFADNEESLVSLARESSFTEFAQAVSCWEAVNDRAGEAERARRVIEGRDAHVTTATDGVTYASGQLPFVAGAEFKAEFDRLEHELFKADWAHERERLGEAATANDLVRTPAQRRADALREMARRSAEPATTAPGAPAPPARTVVNLVMDWATFCAELGAHEGQTDVVYPPRAPASSKTRRSLRRAWDSTPPWGARSAAS